MDVWNDIKEEYMTKHTSFRKLSEKYGVSKDAIGRKAKAERWCDTARQIRDKTATKTVERISDAQANRAAQLQATAGKLLDAMGEMVDDIDSMKKSGRTFNDLSAALINLQKVMMIRSDADIREQEARIAKLRKDAAVEETDRTVTVRIAGGDEAWQK